MIEANHPAAIFRLGPLSWPQRFRVQLPYNVAVGSKDTIFRCSARRIKRRHDRLIETPMAREERLHPRRDQGRHIA